MHYSRPNLKSTKTLYNLPCCGIKILEILTRRTHLSSAGTRNLHNNNHYCVCRRFRMFFTIKWVTPMISVMKTVCLCQNRTQYYCNKNINPN